MVVKSVLVGLDADSELIDKSWINQNRKSEIFLYFNKIKYNSLTYYKLNQSNIFLRINWDFLE